MPLLRSGVPIVVCYYNPAEGAQANEQNFKF